MLPKRKKNQFYLGAENVSGMFFIEDEEGMVCVKILVLSDTGC